MPRHYAPISMEAFKKKVKDVLSKDTPCNIFGNKFEKDLKVDFGFENYDDCGDFGPKSLMGFQTLPGDLHIFGCAAGGDWEHPVFFCLYWDGKKLRAYIPTEGNPWNTTNNLAYGNDSKSDFKNCHKRWPDKYPIDEDDPEGAYFEIDNHSFDEDQIKKDILKRITIAAPKATVDPSKKTLRQRIEGLTFYGCGDEAYELFQATTSLCYQMSGLGEPEKAEKLCEWAEELAKASENHKSEDDEDDKESGRWGS